MQHQTDDVRISEIKELLPPVAVLEKFPATETASSTVFDSRQAIHRILNGEDDRLLVVIGPCSIHDPVAAIEYGKRLKALRDELKGQPALLNVWATWCPTCKAEHEMLNRLAAQGVAIYGINYKDDSAAAREWLQRLGNPYRFNIEDPQGSLGIDLGVYGAPETFLLDKQGIIRAKHVGAIDENVWRSKLAPLYQQLLDEATP